MNIVVPVAWVLAVSAVGLKAWEYRRPDVPWHWMFTRGALALSADLYLPEGRRWRRVALWMYVLTLPMAMVYFWVLPNL